MKNTTIKNANNEIMNIETIRYFVNNDVEYLIFSLNETDDAGYVKLYASKIIDNKARIITDEEEWNLVKEIIKQIVKNNRDGSPLDVIDINEKYLSNITLIDNRVFKLQGNLVNLLSENKNVKEEEPVINDIDDSDDSETGAELDMLLDDKIDYEKLYNDSLIENEKLKEEINLLKQYKEKIEKIEEILK